MTTATRARRTARAKAGTRTGADAENTLAVQGDVLIDAETGEGIGAGGEQGAFEGRPARIRETRILHDTYTRVVFFDGLQPAGVVVVKTRRPDVWGIPTRGTGD